MAQSAVSVSVHALKRPKQILLQDFPRLRSTGDRRRHGRSQNLSRVASSELDVCTHSSALDERTIREISDNHDARVESRGGDAGLE